MASIPYTKEQRLSSILVAAEGRSKEAGVQEIRGLVFPLAQLALFGAIALARQRIGFVCTNSHPNWVCLAQPPRPARRRRELALFRTGAPGPGPRSEYRLQVALGRLGVPARLLRPSSGRGLDLRRDEGQIGFVSHESSPQSPGGSRPAEVRPQPNW